MKKSNPSENIKTNFLISIIVPCFNEAGNIPELHKRLVKVIKGIKKPCQIIYVDDSSTDDTPQILSELKKKNKFVIVKRHSCNKGLAESWITGANAAQGDYSVIIDADLQYQPEDIFRLYKSLMSTNVDIVQGSRSTIGRSIDLRFIYSISLNYILNLIFSMRLKDNKSGFIICKKDTLVNLLTTRFSYKYFQTFLMVAAKHKGYSYSDIEVIFLDRLVGKSFIKFIPVKLFLHLVKDFFYAFYEFRISSKKTSVLSRYIKKQINILEENESFFRGLHKIIYFYTMPLHAWVIGKDVRTYYKELKTTQWLSKKDIKLIQEEKLRNLLNHAYHHVQYYRNLFDENNIDVSKIKSLNDLEKIPFITKKIIENNLYSGLLSDNHNKKNILKIVTSGSTGKPFVMYADKYQLEMRWASTLRSMEWTGYKFGDKCARLWHQTIGMKPLQIVREYLDAFISRRIFIPAYSFDDKNIHKYMKKLQKYNPVLIDGYAESFNFLAQYINNNNNFKINPKAIISSAQILPDQSRAIIESKLNTKVYDKYGSREFSGIAYESCESNIHLVVAENYIVEIIKNNKSAKAGEIGEIVITDLNNYCMPLIRYKIGDLAVKIADEYTSPCGRGLPAIGRIEGRVQAIIFCGNGKYLPGTFFAHFFKEYSHVIQQYKVVQTIKSQIELFIVKGPRFTSESMKNIINDLMRFMGEETKMNIKYVDKIPMVRTGKQQGTVSKLEINFQDLL
jgi:phenylacetate-CoA ligase